MVEEKEIHRKERRRKRKKTKKEEEEEDEEWGVKGGGKVQREELMAMKMIMKTVTNLWMKIVKPWTAMMITRHLYQGVDDGDDSQRNKT